MTERIPYVHTFKDRHGHLRHYLRHRGSKSVSLPGTPGSEEFTAAYDAALARKPKQRPIYSPTDDGSCSYVYFVLTGAGRNIKVKIGVARDPRNRLDALRAGIPGKARIYYVTPGSYDLENYLHKLFAEDRISGEWFIFSRRIKDWITADEKRRREHPENIGWQIFTPAKGNPPSSI